MAPIDRRSFLLASAATLAGCATSAPQAPAPNAEADQDFRALVDRLAERPRGSRAFLLSRYDASQLTPTGRILYEAILPGAEADARLARMPWGDTGFPYALSHRYGAYRRAMDMREGDQPRIIQREIDRQTRQLIADAERGVLAPAFALDATIDAVAAAQGAVATRGGETRTEIAASLGRQVEALRALRANAGDEPGMWRLPGGEDFYAAALQFQLGAVVDPREAHTRALDKARDLQAQADTLLRAQGLTDGDVGSRLRALARDPRYLYPDTDAGKERAVADMADRLARTRGLLSGLLTDANEAPAEVRRLPAAQEANGAQGRRQGSTYFVDLGARRARWTLPSVVHHEPVPGHIYQAPFAGAANPPALQLRYSNGYSEGWSIYAEQLADEMGAFADDPLGRIGYLQWMLFRMSRIVADTGMHKMRWSRERAIDEVRALQGESIAFVSIEEDVMRAAVQPGAQAAQGLAALHIADLRDDTRRRMGDRFELSRFHLAMVEHGPLSPAGLDQAARAALA